MNPTFTRREFLHKAAVASAGGAAGLAFAGCGERQSGRETIRFWNGWTGPDGTKALEIIRRFNEANPDIEMKMQRIEWAVYYRKLYVAGLSDRAPEVFVIHTDSLPRYAQAEQLEPIEPLLGDFPLADLDPKAWAATEVGGTHWGLPVDAHPLGLYWNRPMLAEAGFSAPPTNLAEFTEIARRLNKPSADPSKSRYGFVNSNPALTLYAFLVQFGGPIFNDDQTQCVMDNPENRAALELITRLTFEEKLIPPMGEFDPWIAFRQGRVGMTWNGIFMLPDLQKQADLDFAGGKVAELGTQPGTWGGNHIMCIKRGLSEKKKAAAWRFIRYFSDHSLDWAEAGQIPVRKSLRATERFAQMPVQSAFATMLTETKPYPPVPFQFEFQESYNVMTEKVLRGTTKPAEALTLCQTEVNKMLERRRREAEGLA